jgi:shikimate dehydrogenase
MSDRYGVTGYPLGHTKSPMIHTAFARTTGQDIRYDVVEAGPDGFAQAATRFRAEGGRGLNVTAPFKLNAFEMATEPSERARQAGAANALKFDGERIAADNFDGVGLVSDIKRNLGFPLSGRRVLMMGAGGAVRGALLPFLAEKPSRLVVANRTVSKAKALGEQFAPFGTLETGGYPDVAGQRFDIVINATSASLRGELPAVPADVFAAASLAYELVYGKGLTPFLRLARDGGVPNLADGVGMLVEQAAESFEWWRGVRPDTREVIRNLTIPLV